MSPLCSADDSQVGSPRADFIGVLPREHSRDLHYVIEVVCHPRRQELTHGYETELRMAPATVEVRVGEPERRQRAEVFPPERGELVEELRQRSALRHRELRKAIELLEGSGLAGLNG
jgi:hypothetical protein